MQTCRRCGLKRYHDTPSGPVYQRFYDIFGTGLIQECKHWLKDGYLQIKFEGPGLPTKAYVTLKPRSSKKISNWDGWGEAFTVEGMAHPINENKGFQIQVYPNSELGGVYSMNIISRNSNHVTKDQIRNLIVTYGGSVDEEIELLEADLQKLKKPAISSKFNCSKYVN